MSSVDRPGGAWEGRSWRRGDIFDLAAIEGDEADFVGGSADGDVLPLESEILSAAPAVRRHYKMEVDESGVPVMPQPQEASLLRHLRKLAAAHRSSRECDRALLQQFVADGSETAFKAIVERHGRTVLGVCCSVLGHQQDAEDAFQATFLVLAR